MHDQMLWELSIELLTAMLKNPHINIGDQSLPTMAVNHAERMIDELESRLSQPKLN